MRKLAVLVLFGFAMMVVVGCDNTDQIRNIMSRTIDGLKAEKVKVEKERDELRATVLKTAKINGIPSAAEEKPSYEKIMGEMDTRLKDGGACMMQEKQRKEREAAEAKRAAEEAAQDCSLYLDSSMATNCDWKSQEPNAIDRLAETYKHWRHLESDADYLENALQCQNNVWAKFTKAEVVKQAKCVRAGWLAAHKAVANYSGTLPMDVADRYGTGEPRLYAVLHLRDYLWSQKQAVGFLDSAYRRGFQEIMDYLTKSKDQEKKAELTNELCSLVCDDEYADFPAPPGGSKKAMAHKLKCDCTKDSGGD